MNERAVAFATLLFMAACGGQPPEGEPTDGEGERPGIAGGVVRVVAPIAGNQTFPAIDPVTGDMWFSVYEDAFDDQTIMVARRGESGWVDPEVASFSGEFGDRAPRFSPDGSFLLITSNRPRPGASELGDMNIWRVERGEDGWGEAEWLETAVNSEAADVHPSVTSSGVWVASSRQGGMGRSDLYRVNANGDAVHLGPPLNDERSQPDLWVSADESWMILAITDHPEGYGGDDLYLSWREGDGWATPVNLGPAINSAEYEYGPWVSPEGEHLYFTSHRDGPARTYRVALEMVNEMMRSR